MTTSTQQQVSGQQPNLDQQEFDRRLAKETPEEMDRQVQGLVALYRSKVRAGQTPSQNPGLQEPPAEPQPEVEETPRPK